MVPRENKNNAYAKFGGTNKEYYGIIPSGLLQLLHVLLQKLPTNLHVLVLHVWPEFFSRSSEFPAHARGEHLGFQISIRTVKIRGELDL